MAVTTIYKKMLSRVGIYSLLIGITLTVLSGCNSDPIEEPNIDWTNFEPDITLSPSVNDELSRLVDLNNDGIDDVKIAIANFNDTTYNIDYAYAVGLGDTKVLARIDSIDINGTNVGFRIAIGLFEGSPIGAAQTFWDDHICYLGTSGIILGNQEDFGDFLGNELFIGVQFLIAGSVHYGWIKVSVEINDNFMTLKEYAYNTEADASIDAGQK